MSVQVFPSLPGMGFNRPRTSQWNTIPQTAASGKETRIGLWSSPIWMWDLNFEVLRSSTTLHELQDLAGFFNGRQGMFDSFLYTDPDDNAVTAQQIGTGNGSQTTFQMIRSFGGFIEPVLAPNTVSNVYLNGANQASGWSVSSWGSATPGILTFVTPPGAGVAITSTFSFYFPCRFLDDSVDFNLFMNKLYDLKSVKFKSLK